MSAEYTPVLALSELPVGTMRAVLLGERELLLCHTKDGLFALDNVCSHAYATPVRGAPARHAPDLPAARGLL